MNDLREAVDAAILVERKRLLPLFLWVRVITAAVLFGGMSILAARGEVLARATLRGQICWLTGTLGVVFLNAFVSRVRLWLRWATVVVDLPLFFLTCHDALRVAGTNDRGAIALWYLAGAGVLMISASISMSRPLIWATGAIGMLFTFLLYTDANLMGSYWPLLIVVTLASFAFFSVALIGRTERLALYFAREQRETALLNEELKRQIADRAGQLASAIARLSVTPRALEVGTIIEDRYRVARQIGSGGMGAVYEVERISDGNRLALKVLTGVADREALARFAREAQIAAQLHHPNIVSIVDVDVSKSGMLFLVMELVAGSSLATQRAKFGDRKWALPILKQIAEGLSVIHARGIVHRDLKPANVLFDGDRAKLADFGIASLSPNESDSTVSVGLTQTGAFMGTPLYMAPELDRGARAATPASDVFALGIIAYEMLSGRSPFAQPPVLAKTQARPQPLDGSIGGLIDRCLNFDSAARPSAAELVRAL